MTRKIALLLAGFTCTALLFSAVEGAEAKKAREKTKVLMLVGGHGYDEGGFEQLWSGLDGVACQVFKGAPYSAFDDVGDFDYDVIVMFNPGKSQSLLG